MRGAGILWMFAAMAVSAGAATLKVFDNQVGTTPTRLGYNLGHFMQGSNAADWFRYSGAEAARIFIGVSDIEPSDDISPVGDGVTSQASFASRRGLLRANAASSSAALSNTYVRWSTFTGNYADLLSGNNRIRPSYVLGELRDRGVDVLVNLTASPGRFPITGTNDWGGKWELWQHYYAQAFLLSRDYGVRKFSMFNEPNGWTGMTEADWLVRLWLCSDAIQAGVADMNSRYGRNLVPQVFAPNTANGAEKYNTPGADEEETQTWGRDAVANRHLMWDGTSSANWMTFHVYNYQKYSTRAYAGSGLSGYVTDYDALRSYIDADMAGETQMPIAITEFNVRTGATYDTVTATQDSLSDSSALGGNYVALTERGIREMYLFKFAQTQSDSFYGVAKNGTHYVDNATSGLNNYGTATKCAEVYRLFNKAAKGGRERLNFTITDGPVRDATSGLWSMATRDATAGTCHVFIANRESSDVSLNLDFSILPIAQTNAVWVEEVSGNRSGEVVLRTLLSQGKLNGRTIPAQSVWLVTVPLQTVAAVSKACVADAQLADGVSKNNTGGTATGMVVRADGTADGRRVSLIRIPVPGGNSPNVRNVFLEMDAATTTGTSPIQTHVYGVTNNAWTEETVAWANMGAILKQNVSNGSEIRHNVVNSPGMETMILGQMVVDSPVASTHAIDVTAFAKSRTDGFASFLVVQEHRWDIAQPQLTTGDIQAAGVVISSRESSGGGPRLVALTSDVPPSIIGQPQSSTVNPGASVTFQVTAEGTAPLSYQWEKNGVAIPGATSSSYTITNSSIADAGNYRVTVGNIADARTSGEATLIVRGLAPVSREGNIRGGSFAATDVDEVAQGYLMVKYNTSLDTSRKAYFQFDLPLEADLNAPATFRLGFNNTFAQQVQLWALNQAAADFSPLMTWNTAPANQTTTNQLITGPGGATPIGPDVRINPGSGLTPYAFTVPRLGDFVFSDRITLVLTGVEDAANLLLPSTTIQVLGQCLYGILSQTSWGLALRSRPLFSSAALCRSPMTA